MDEAYEAPLSKMEDVPIVTKDRCCVNLTSSRNGMAKKGKKNFLLFDHVYVRVHACACPIWFSENATEDGEDSTTEYRHWSFIKRHKLIYLVQSLILVSILSFAGLLIYLSVVSGEQHYVFHKIFHCEYAL